MDNLHTYNCKTCGNPLDELVVASQNGIVKCPICEHVWTIARKEASPDTLYFLRMGEHDLDTCKFEDARVAYEKAAEIDRNEPEAYFGKALAAFKVQYIKDDARRCLQPICHTFTDKKFSENIDYRKALSLATPEQQQLYRSRAKEIEAIAEEFNRLQQEGLDYDCFICVKVSELDEAERGGGRKTEDSSRATEIYYDLIDAGLKPFYSERDVKNRAGVDYEALILYALYTSECMLIVCSDERYLETKWMRSEYTRFSAMIANEEKERDAITFIFKGTPIEKLPGRNGKIQGIDYGLRGATDRIIKFVQNHTVEARRRREEAKHREQEREAELRRALEEQKEERRAIEEQQRAFEAQLKKMQASGGGVSVENLLLRAEQELMDGETESAKKYYTRALETDPRNGNVWWGQFLIERGVKSEAEILERLDWKSVETITASRNYTNAQRYADEKLKERIGAFRAQMESPALWWGKFLGEMGVQNEQEILDTVTKQRIKEVKQSKNYKLAQKYADEAFSARIDAFEEGLKSPDTNFELFLQEFSVADERQLIDGITEQSLESIEASDLFRTADRGAQGALKERIDRFKGALYSGETWWARLLEEFNAGSDEKLIGEMDPEILSRVERSDNYRNAVKYASGAFKERLERFQDTVYAGDIWWDNFLAEFRIDDEEEIFEHIRPATLKQIQESPSFDLLSKYAKDASLTRLESFRSRLYSGELWWEAFLRESHVKEPAELLQDYDDALRRSILQNPYFVNAQKYASKEFSPTIVEFEELLSEHAKNYEAANKEWEEMLRSYKVKNVASLNSLREPISSNIHYMKAVEYAECAEANKLAAKFRAAAETQESHVLENLREDDKNRRIEKHRRQAEQAKAARVIVGAVLLFVIPFTIAMLLESFGARLAMTYVRIAIVSAIAILAMLLSIKHRNEGIDAVRKYLRGMGWKYVLLIVYTVASNWAEAAYHHSLIYYYSPDNITAYYIFSFAMIITVSCITFFYRASISASLPTIFCGILYNVNIWLFHIIWSKNCLHWSVLLLFTILGLLAVLLTLIDRYDSVSAWIVFGVYAAVTVLFFFTLWYCVANVAGEVPLVDLGDFLLALAQLIGWIIGAVVVIGIVIGVIAHFSGS